MRRLETMARLVIGALVVSAAATPLLARARTPMLHARMAENGGWTSGTLTAQVGEPLHLKLTSDDVQHGFAVAQMDMESVDVDPGKVSDVTLLFKKPGNYTFYCTRWCGVNHWRMRGTIEVTGAGPAQTSGEPPLYVKLGLDLDAPHDAGALPAVKPSASRVDSLVPAGFTQPDFYRSHAPADAWATLRGEPSLARLSDQQVWDMVAFIWQANSTPEDRAAGAQLYAQNCAACHGATGGGNGVFADKLAAASETMGNSTLMIKRPAEFSDPKRMLGASPALLEGKILRGGMGTGMPAWGPIFTEKQIWQLVSYIYTFQFEETR